MKRYTANSTYENQVFEMYEVVEKNSFLENGHFGPLTESGVVIINGFVCSNYAYEDKLQDYTH